MRDTALYAASTDHLVIASMHTTDALYYIKRLLDMYPTKEHQRIRDVLAKNLRVAIHQRLVRVNNDTASTVGAFLDLSQAVELVSSSNGETFIWETTVSLTPNDFI